MKAMTEEEFNKVEKLKMTKQTYVKGEYKKVGDTVAVSGNAKIQLLSTKKAERIEEKKESK